MLVEFIMDFLDRRLYTMYDVFLFKNEINLCTPSDEPFLF